MSRGLQRRARHHSEADGHSLKVALKGGLEDFEGVQSSRSTTSRPGCRSSRLLYSDGD